MSSGSAPLRTIGRYALYGEIAAGGMATVHYGRLLGPVGFARTVAIKRLHAQYAKDPEFVSMFLDEARLAARLQHPNVVSTLDVVASRGELFLVMEYVQGESLSRLLRTASDARRPMPPAVATAIVAGVLHGLHCAHEARNERGEPLGIVHRDVSPQNVLVGKDGAPRVIDFGVAKAAGSFHATREGTVKGKLPYMSPEQVMGQGVDRTADTYAAAIVLWEALAGRRLFKRDNDGAVVQAVLSGATEPPSAYAEGIPSELDALVMRGLDRDKTKRFQTAREFALALERAMQPALASDVGEWVQSVAKEVLLERAERVAELESVTDEPTSAEDVMAKLARSSSTAPPGAPSSAPPPAIDQGGSQVSNISVVTPTGKPAHAAGQGEEQRSGRLFKALAVLGAGGGLVAAIVSTVLVLRSGGPAKSEHVEARAAAPAPASSAPPPVASTAPPDTASAPARPAESAAAVPASVSRPARVRPVAAGPATPTAGCSPPYRIGPDGEKIYKRECIH